MARLSTSQPFQFLIPPHLLGQALKVVSITEHADDSPTGKLMEAIIESVDEFYSENFILWTQ